MRVRCCGGSSRGPGLLRILVRVTAALVGLLCVIGLAGCLFDLISRDLVGPYRLFAGDNSEELAVVYDPDNNGGTLRVGSTVIEVGWDDRYLVAANRRGEPGSDLSYYYLDMTKDHIGGISESEGILFGPFTEEEFKSLKAEIGLPEFSVHYPELR
jgi:hypothetical protein